MSRVNFRELVREFKTMKEPTILSVLFMMAQERYFSGYHYCSENGFRAWLLSIITFNEKWSRLPFHMPFSTKLHHLGNILEANRHTFHFVYTLDIDSDRTIEELFTNAKSNFHLALERGDGAKSVWMRTIFQMFLMLPDRKMHTAIDYCIRYTKESNSIAQMWEVGACSDQYREQKILNHVHSWIKHLNLDLINRRLYLEILVLCCYVNDRPFEAILFYRAFLDYPLLEWAMFIETRTGFGGTSAPFNIYEFAFDWQRRFGAYPETLRAIQQRSIQAMPLKNVSFSDEASTSSSDVTLPTDQVFI
jgi:hypothetical protein